jgi:hypothetical protein
MISRQGCVKIPVKARKPPICYIRYDNSGENNYFNKLVKDHGFNITFEFYSPSTPQQNGWVERKFSLLYRYMRALIQKAQLPESLRKKLWTEAAHHSIELHNTICTPHNAIDPYKCSHRIDPPYVKHLHVFGKLVVTSNNLKFLAKSSDRGILALYIGLSKGHAYNTYIRFNLSTNKVLLGQNVKFLYKMYGKEVINNYSNNPFEPLMDDNDNNDNQNYDDDEEVLQE